MKGAEPSRRQGVRSRRSRSLSGLLDGCPGISQGHRSRLGEDEYEEGEEYVEEEESGETEVEAASAGSPEAPEVPNLAHYYKTLASEHKPNYAKMVEQMTQFLGQLTQAVTPRSN
ncbi:hypothetical protein O181_067221 [Austropuccinia psidii MF-1]|uniref:Uncharacterized protein n=1 Tax=Austropuccinia psidii MF-1 TaxID=1389203 RepID=A0A9Q3ESG8_9BASI|nr:hypothetical protein [Austropuccinia psidii MF-1]